MQRNVNKKILNKKNRAWINEVMAKVTAAELAQDVDAAEKLISRHEEHRAEISSRQDTLKRFYATGNDLIRKVRGVFCILVLLLVILLLRIRLYFFIQGKGR
jgi:hypothetical protein